MRLLSPRPPGSVPALTGYVGLAALVLGTITLRLWAPFDDFANGLTVLCLTMVVMIGCEAFVRLRDTTISADDVVFFRLNAERLKTGLNADLIVKYYGLSLTFAGIVALTYILPLHEGPEILYLKHILMMSAPGIVVFGGIYVWVTHAMMTDPRDTLWHFGRYFLPGGKQKTDIERVYHHILGWTIKVFFLPLMFSYFLQEWQFIAHNDGWMSGLWRGDMPSFYEDTYRFFFFIDLAFCVVGYTAALSLLNTHIRYAEWRVGGWLACLICYSPFWPLVTAYYIDYWDDLKWGGWLSHTPWLYDVWAVMILSSLMVYTWATVCFGLRFSNMTHRGIVTHGPYAMTKHPAYLSKNLSWWLIEIPFVAASWPEAVKNCLMLLQVNLIYYIRARYEESMLSHDPLYASYAEEIRQQRGVIPTIRRYLVKKRS